MDYTCKVCGYGHISVEIPTCEMMYGTREPFLYYQCGQCESLQISVVPEDAVLAKHYPINYYSYQESPSVQRRRNTFRGWLAAVRDLDAIGTTNPLGKVFRMLRPVRQDLESLALLSLHPTDHILDVGCGGFPVLLNCLARLNFKYLLGIDPFISRNTVSDFGVVVEKKYLSEMEGKFDLIMFHHSLEHVSDPLETLLKARKLLNPKGRCLIRIPTSSSDAFEFYGAQWVQLDPPRHLVLFSRTGMDIIAAASGFVVEKVTDDSTRFQFTGSELYRKNVPLTQQVERNYFSKRILREYDHRARDMNAAHRGDAAAFILRVKD